jgi:hypothetical protein
MPYSRFKVNKNNTITVISKSKAADTGFHKLFSISGSAYLPYMEEMIIPLVTKLVAPERYWQERQWGICIWDDMVEFTGPAAVKYQHLFVPNLLNYLGDSSAEVRQAAAYGCGIMAQFGGETFAGETNHMLNPDNIVYVLILDII